MKRCLTKLVGKVRFELTHSLSPRQEPSPLGHFPMVGTPRIELDCPAFQTGAKTTLARYPYLVDTAGFEPATPCLQGRRSPKMS